MLDTRPGEASKSYGTNFLVARHVDGAIKFHEVWDFGGQVRFGIICSFEDAG